MKKDKQFSIRISEQDLETICRKAAQAHMSQSDYVTACCLGKRIVILDGLREVLRQQKAIGLSLIHISVKHDLLVISDDVYNTLLYAGEEAPCIASFPGMKERTVIVNSFSRCV